MNLSNESRFRDPSSYLILKEDKKKGNLFTKNFLIFPEAFLKIEFYLNSRDK